MQKYHWSYEKLNSCKVKTICFAKIFLAQPSGLKAFSKSQGFDWGKMSNINEVWFIKKSPISMRFEWEKMPNVNCTGCKKVLESYRNGVILFFKSHLILQSYLLLGRIGIRKNLMLFFKKMQQIKRGIIKGCFKY